MRQSLPNTPQAAIEEPALKRILEALEAGKGARTVELSADEAPLIKQLMLLTTKPMLYAANVEEDDLGNKGAENKYVQDLKKRAAEEGVEVVVVSAKVGRASAPCGTNAVSFAVFRQQQHRMWA